MSVYPLGNEEIHDRIKTIKDNVFNDEGDEKAALNAALDLVESTLKVLHNLAAHIENLEIAIRNR